MYCFSLSLINHRDIYKQNMDLQQNVGEKFILTGESTAQLCSSNCYFSMCRPASSVAFVITMFAFPHTFPSFIFVYNLFSLSCLREIPNKTLPWVPLHSSPFWFYTGSRDVLKG